MLSPQVTTTSNNRRLLEVTAKYDVLINTTADADAAALSTVTEVLQNVTKATQVTNASDIAWCGAFCEKHAESIDLQQTGEHTLVMGQCVDVVLKTVARPCPCHECGTRASLAMMPSSVRLSSRPT
jgi:hypothetical protein